MNFSVRISCRRRASGEPLYITALKHAGCQITADTRPQHIETMDLAPYREKVQAWYKEAQLPRPPRQAVGAGGAGPGFFLYYGNPVLRNIDFKIERRDAQHSWQKRGRKEHPVQPDLRLYQSRPGKHPLNGADIADKSI